MFSKLLTIVTLFFTTILGCKNVRKFPEVQPLTEFEQTEFVPTLEHQIDKNKNSIYCATLLLAWDEIRNQIDEPISISDEYIDLNLLNNSTSFKDVLNQDEYTVDAIVQDLGILAKAEFNKTLPFTIEMNSFENGLTFNNKKVNAFGVNGSDSNYKRLQQIKILEYQNDENFMIKITPKDNAHEIILFKTEENLNTLADLVKRIDQLPTQTIPNKEKWKYTLNNDDIVRIPKFKFNIETNYSNLEGSHFTTSSNNYTVDKAWQRTAFLLDEKGAEVESEAEIIVTTAIPKELEPQKNLVFDKPFLLLLKRTESKNPYFAMWVANTELMTTDN